MYQMKFHKKWELSSGRDQLIKYWNQCLTLVCSPIFYYVSIYLEKKYPWNAMEKTEENSGIKISSKASKSEHEQIIFVAEEKMNNFKTWLQIRSIPRENIEQYSYWLWFWLWLAVFLSSRITWHFLRRIHFFVMTP